MMMNALILLYILNDDVWDFFDEAYKVERLCLINGFKIILQILSMLN